MPRGWVLHRYAGSLPASGARARRTPSDPIGMYIREVTVDLGNDGMAPPAVFTAGGGAVAFVGPRVAGEAWALDQCYLSTSVGLLDAAQCIVYAGPIPAPVAGIPQYAVTGSLAGGGSQFGLGGVVISFGHFVYAIWAGGTPGASAFLRVTGTKTAFTTP